MDAVCLYLNFEYLVMKHLKCAAYFLLLESPVRCAADLPHFQEARAARPVGHISIRLALSQQCQNMIPWLALLVCPLARADWQTHRGVDCYQGAGGVPLTPEYSHSLEECQAACSGEEGCLAVVRRAGEDAPGVCYKRSGIIIAECVQDPVWDLYTWRNNSEITAPGPQTMVWSQRAQTPALSKQARGAWKVHEGLDCYDGKGGVAMAPDPYSNSLSLAECKAACTGEEGCKAVVKRAGEVGPGVCYRRSNVVLGECVRDPVWNLYTQEDSSEMTTPRSQTTTSPKQARTPWKVHEGVDCYGGKGGVAMSPDPYSNSLSLEECKAACSGEEGCKAVVRRSGEVGPGVCYRRSNVVLGRCVTDPAWSLFTLQPDGEGTPSLPAAGWKVKQGLDCYEGRGGTALQPDPYSLNLSLVSCRAACSSLSSCQGVVTGSQGQCYLRSSIVLSQCVRDPQWTLHLSPRYSPTLPTPTTPSSGCQGGIQPYPRSLPNSHYYTRLCTTKRGLRVVSGPRASARALERTAQLLDRVTAMVDPRVTASMTTRGFRHAVMAAYPGELTTHLPEHAFLDPGYWNERARGLGATLQVPLGSSAEENVLCYPSDRYRGRDITVHEFAHSLHLLGLALVFPGFESELRGLYSSARSSGLWGSSHYAMTNYIEYFAEGVQSFFDANLASSGGPATREQLRRRDPALYSLILRYLGSNPWRHSC